MPCVSLSSLSSFLLQERRLMASVASQTPQAAVRPSLVIAEDNDRLRNLLVSIDNTPATKRVNTKVLSNHSP
jgi:hypothetical protein